MRSFKLEKLMKKIIELAQEHSMLLF